MLTSSAVIRRVDRQSNWIRLRSVQTRFNIFIDAQNLEIRYGPDQLVLPVKGPREFSTDVNQMKELAVKVATFKWKHRTWLQRLVHGRMQQTLVVIHDGVAATRKGRVMPFDQIKTYTLTSALASALSIPDIAPNDISLATATLIVDKDYCSFQILHGGGIWQQCYCWNVNNPTERDQFLRDTREKWNEALNRPQSTNLTTAAQKLPALRAELQRDNYFSALDQLPETMRRRGLYLFTRDSEPAPTISMLLQNSLGLKLTPVLDLQASIWTTLTSFDLAQFLATSANGRRT